MNLRRFLHPDSIRLELQTRRDPPGDLPDDWNATEPRNVQRVREEVLDELSRLLDRGAAVVNPRRLARDLLQREKRAGTALGQGIAIPHVRTLQVKSFVMAFGRSREGLPFQAPDGQLVHLFFAMAAPPHDDRTYLRVYKVLAGALLDPATIEALLSAEEAGEVLRALKQVE